MSRRAVRAGAAAEAAAGPLRALRAELEIPETYDGAALAEAEAVAGEPVIDGLEREDLREIPFVTLDPLGSKDLDQAFHLERAGDGYRLRYAIADVASYVVPGGALDAEVHRRGVTYYGPDGRFGLHPPVLSEDAASLLPDQDRRAAVWHLTFDPDGVMTEVAVRRAVVRSREQLDYVAVQQALDDGTAPEMLQLLPELGTLRQDLQIARGGATIDVPEQEVGVSEDGARYLLRYRVPLPVEEHNAQLSLAAGAAAARLQLAAGVGLWRTLDPAREQDVARLRRVAHALGLSWPRRMPYGVFARDLDVRQPAHAAFATEATSLFRGAGYLPFGTPAHPEPPLGGVHSAIAAQYAHVTAPLRRLVDRYGTEIALARTAGTPVPEWVTSGLDALPAVMAAAVQRAGAYERNGLDLLESLIMERRVGRTYDAIVVDTAKPRQDGTVRATVLLDSPAVRSKVDGPVAQLREGTRARVRVSAVDVAQRSVTLELAAP